MQRISGRQAQQLRDVSFTTSVNRHAEGSVLVAFGDTRVLCTASVEARVPPFLRDKGQGWVTAEYGMLPRSTHQRMAREAARGKQSGRTMEIQRLIGRSLRGIIALELLGEHTITIDCDVLQADGGTRTAAISGSWVVLRQAVDQMLAAGTLKQDPIKAQVAAISVGIWQGTPILDLDYEEDSHAETDMNLVMDSTGRFIEIQGTAEGQPFDRAQLQQLLDLGESGIRTLMDKQLVALRTVI